jgi:hypothetical protein
MSETQIATALLRAQFQGAHDWLEATLEGVTNIVATWQPPGLANPIGAEYLHHLTAEDFFINGLLSQRAPLMSSSYANRTGMSEPPPMDNWSDWGKQVTVDMATARAYAQAVYTATDTYLATLHDGDLANVIDVPAPGMGSMPLGVFLSILLANCNNHCGEISCMKGLQGLKGYPF